MSLLDIPVWTIPPDWTDPVTEGLEWKTNVFVSRTKVEQRQSTRLSPRRYLDFTVTAIGDSRRYFDALIATPFQTEFYMPVWYDIGQIYFDAAIGDNTLIARNLTLSISSSDVIMLVGARPFEYEILEVTSILGVGTPATLFNLASTLTRDWPKGSLLYAVRRVSLSEQPSFVRLSDDAIRATVRLEFNGPNDWNKSVSLPTYRDFPVVVFDNNEADNPGGSYFRASAVLDNGVGQIYRKDLAGSNFSGFQFSSLAYGPGAADDLRSLLYQLRGKAAAFWIVHPTTDFVLAARAASGATEIVVDRSGFTDLGGPQVGRQDIRILMRDGTSIYRRISSSSILPNGTTEALELTSALTAEIRPNSVASISFMAIARLDQDLVEILHVSDHEGAATATVATRLIPNTRVAEDWTAMPFPLGEMGNCGPTVAGRFWVRRNNGPWNGNASYNVSIGEGGIDISALSGALYPCIGFNSGFDFSLPSVTVNFGASEFVHAVPYRAEAWDPAAILEDVIGLELSEDHLTAAVGLEQTGKFTKASTNTDTRLGFRYYEATVNARAQNNYFGFSTAGGSRVMLADDGGVGGTAVNVGSVSAGDVIGLLIYSGNGI